MNQKGGVGKTTLAIHAAEMMHRYGHKVILVDADPQASALNWADLRENCNFPVIGKASPSLGKDLEKMAEDYDYIVIDAPPRLEQLGRAVIASSDLIVIPVKPSRADILATQNLIESIEEVKQYRPHVMATMILNGRIKGTKITNQIIAALEDLDCHLLPGSIYNRVGFSEAYSYGYTVMDDPARKEAAKDIEIMLAQIESFVKSEIKKRETEEAA